jgi:hypothetical protein
MMAKAQSTPSPGRHSGRIFFRASTVLDIKKDASGMTTWFVEH